MAFFRVLLGPLYWLAGKIFAIWARPVIQPETPAELLHDPETLHAVTMLRRTLTSMHHVDAMEQLTKQLGKFKTNAEFIQLISGSKVLD